MTPIHILVVEDSKIAQKAMQTNLTEQGCTVDVADDAQSALERVKDRNYDIILMDIGLGQGLDGFDIAAQIKATSPLNRKTSIAIVSGQNEAEYRAKAEAAGMVGYFNKPFTQKEAKKIVGFIKNTQLIRIIDHMK